MRKLAGSIIVIAFFAIAPAANADITGVFNGDIPCATQADGVRFCGSTPPVLSTTKTWDGVPIDVNVAFPAAPSSGSDGPYPLVIIGHGYGGSKVDLGTMQPFLDRGFAVFAMTDRGFNGSCGNSASQTADPSGCANGYIRLMDDRYEVRDAQFFAGELADEGLVEPTKIGATGGSYGGGLSMALAALKDRTMLPGGTLVPWKSPSGTPMSLAAAAPNIPWTNLAYALQPNGSTLDYVKDAPYKGDPGVEKMSFVDGIYLVGCSIAGFCAPEGSDPQADLTGWKNLIEQGEPYLDDPKIQAILDEMQAHHSSYGIDHSEPPAPLLISNGFTDDLFPVDENVRFYNRTKSQYPNAPVSLFDGDFGHMRGQNKPDVTGALNDATLAWLDYYVKGSGTKPFQGVTAYTQTCPSTAPSGGPYTAKSWASIAPGEVRLDSASAKTIQPNAGDPSIGHTFDPVPAGKACATAPGADQPGVASYRLPKVQGKGYTLLGSPTVIADFKSASSNSQVAARLLDVGPDGQETLVARGLWRPPTGKKPVEHVFQLHPGAWHFAAGHIAKLELLPNDAPYGRASNGQQKVTVSNLELRLPVHETPGSDGGAVGAPSPKVLPKGYKLATEFKGFGKTAMKVAGRKLVTAGNKLPIGVKCPKSWVACDEVSVQVEVSLRPGSSEAFGEAAGPNTRIKGGATKTMRQSLPSEVRKYLATHNSLKAKVTVGSSEQASPTVVKRKIVAG